MITDPSTSTPAPELESWAIGEDSRVVVCPYCRRVHWHANVLGLVAGHCHLPRSPYNRTGYTLTEGGTPPPLVQRLLRQRPNAKE